MDPQLTHPFAHRFDIPGVAEPEAIDTGGDLGGGAAVAQIVEPSLERLGLLDVDHLRDCKP
jgi:hypothetical protein